MQFTKDTGQNRKSSNGHGDTQEQKDQTKRPLRVVHERDVEVVGCASTKSKRDQHTSNGNDKRLFKASHHHANIQFQTNQEQVEDQTQISDQFQVAQRRSRENGFHIMRNIT